MNSNKQKKLLLKYKMAARLDQMDNMAEAMSKALHFYPDSIYSITLCLEELLTNTINYGSRNDGETEIQISIYLNTDYLEIFIEDNAQAFNPFLSAPEPIINSSLDERKIGGLGVYLVKKLMDKFTYSYNHCYNKVSLYKKIT